MWIQVAIYWGVFVIVPLAFAFTPDRWFWKADLLRRLRSKVELYDARVINFDGVSTLKSFRTKGANGDQTVLCHYLWPLGRDIIFEFRQSMLGATGLMLVIALLITLMIAKRSPVAAHPVADQLTTIVATFAEVGLWIPLGTAAASLRGIVVLHFYYQQVSRFRGILD